jgi:hypothetical protein
MVVYTGSRRAVIPHASTRLVIFVMAMMLITLDRMKE